MEAKAQYAARIFQNLQLTCWDRRKLKRSGFGYGKELPGNIDMNIEKSAELPSADTWVKLGISCKLVVGSIPCADCGAVDGAWEAVTCDSA